MQNVSEEFKRIAAGDYTTETKITINGAEYGENKLYSVTGKNNLFDDDPNVGKAIIGEVTIVMDAPEAPFPEMAEIRIFTRVYNDDEVSEWIPKGIFYIDERIKDEECSQLRIIGYNAMMKTEVPYPSSTLEWPATRRQVLNEICAITGIEADDRTLEAFPSDSVRCMKLPSGYTIREILGYIASTKCGCFCISDEGKLLFVALNSLPPETNYLIREDGSCITFGGTRILLRG